MCGIAGFYHSAGKFNQETLEAMTLALAHRGPDAAGYHLNGPVGLGHRRLSILDLSSAANQPMRSADGNALVIFNGEIYNFKEIAADLGLNTRTSSDTEVLLEAYLAWGPQAIHRFNGMFAFAIWHEPKQELFICRDRMGIKPLYYLQNEDGIAFASELKSLLSLRNHYPFTLNAQAVHDFLLLGYIPEPQSIVAEVRKLPSGSYALYKNGKFLIESYWQPEEQVSAECLTNEIKAKEQLKSLVNSSVKYRMISDVPFGTFLSGGIDSSLVTAVAQHNSGHPVNTFSIGFNDSKHNESHYAEQVANYLGTHHHTFTVTEHDALECLDRMVDAYDEPYADSSAIPTMLVSKLARKHVTMTLSGDGGDELFLGYGAYTWARRLANPFVKAFKYPIHQTLATFGNNRMKRAAGLFIDVPETQIRPHIFSQEQYYFSENEVQQLINKPSHTFTPLDFSTPRKLMADEAQALFDLRYYLKDDLLTKVDRASMQFSLETRVPLLDYRIVTFALNLSPELKNKSGVAKYLLKQVLFDYVPAHFFDRPKWGFSIPLDKWLQKDLHYLIDRYCSDDACRNFGLINEKVLRFYKEQFEAGHTYYYNRLWQIVVLHKSLERLNLTH
ncbi:MAG: asparagine synthase (glutamine-hydrolyzing) [Bacteroidia bacterium]|nr:asparagine synthase (glutamine-hydrolyzing) [Bacteroidia bacterium]